MWRQVITSKRGQLLAKIDESVWQPQVNPWRPRWSRPRRKRPCQPRSIGEPRPLKPREPYLRREIEKRRALSITDAANVKVAAAMLAEAEARLNRTRVVAPADGGRSHTESRSWPDRKPRRRKPSSGSPRVAKSKCGARSLSRTWPS